MRHSIKVASTNSIYSFVIQSQIQVEIIWRIQVNLNASTNSKKYGGTPHIDESTKSSNKVIFTFFTSQHCIRPYHVENTSSRPITEVKQRWAALVLGWVTAWEYAVLYTFCLKQNTPTTSTTHFSPPIFVYGHTTLKTPVLVRSLKLSKMLYIYYWTLKFQYVSVFDLWDSFAKFSPGQKLNQTFFVTSYLKQLI